MLFDTSVVNFSILGYKNYKNLYRGLLQVAQYNTQRGLAKRLQCYRGVRVFTVLPISSIRVQMFHSMKRKVCGMKSSKPARSGISSKLG